MIGYTKMSNTTATGLKRAGSWLLTLNSWSPVDRDGSGSLRYDVVMRYAHGGGLTPKEQEKRERARLEAAERFARGEKTEAVETPHGC